jgi:hypothetical protein
MPVALALPPNGPLYRVARLPDPLAWPDRRFIGSSRFDDPQDEFSVLYLAEQRVGCFIEALAGFRPDLELLARLAHIGGTDELLPSSAVPSAWRALRRVGRLTLETGQRWLDLRAPETLQALRIEFAAVLVDLGIEDLDISASRGPSRTLTRQIARWAYEQGFQGIVYRSRFSDAIDCWAVFEGARVTPLRPDEAITWDDPDLVSATSLFGLNIER